MFEFRRWVIKRLLIDLDVFWGLVRGHWEKEGGCSDYLVGNTINHSARRERWMEARNQVKQRKEREKKPPNKTNRMIQRL
jgi:hypothetical protein